MTGFEPQLSELEHPKNTLVLFRCIAGSRAYGTHHPDSDRDIRGIYAVPGKAYLSLEQPVSQVSDQKGDIVYYALRRFLELAADANPNIIELLFMPKDCVLHQSPLFQPILAARDMFITQKAYQSHVGYASAQIKKAKGRNKWVNNPHPVESPKKQDFCWVMPYQTPTGSFPMRSLPLTESGFDLNFCRCASVNHVKGLYRLYAYPKETAGVFRKGKLVCETIPISDENQYFVGLLFFHQEAYDQTVRDHRHYWQWVKERNPKRWSLQEDGLLDYDAKNMMHCFRLVYSGAHILREGRPLVRFEGEKLAFLKAILAGSFSYETLMDRLEKLLAEFESLKQQSTLPENPDPTEVEALLFQVTQRWEATHER